MEIELSKLPIVDKAAALDRMDGDEELYGELIAIYLEDVPKQFAVLKAELGAGHIDVVERQAHSLKSASANVGAEKLRAIAREMELAAHEKNPLRVENLIPYFKSEFDTFEKAARE